MTTHANIAKILRANTGERGLHDVFTDFCAMTAAAIRNRVDPTGFQEREDDYERTRARYTPAQMDRFIEAFALVTLELTENPRDVLGETYMQLGIANRHQGQFFTPYSIAQLMANMQVSDATTLLLTRPHLTIYEPACGAGAILIAITQALAAQGINYQEQIHVTADDISAVAVHMTYVQLSLLGVPALVNRRNSLTLEHFDTWPTPAHILGNWSKKTAPEPGDPNTNLLQT